MSSIIKVEPDGSTPLDAETGATYCMDHRWLVNELEMSRKLRNSQFPGSPEHLANWD